MCEEKTITGIYNSIKLTCDTAYSVCDKFHLLAHPDRIMIVTCLLSGPLSSNDLSLFINIKYCNLINNLYKLRLAGIIVQDGSQHSITYRLADEKAQRIAFCLSRLIKVPHGLARNAPPLFHHIESINIG